MVELNIYISLYEYTICYVLYRRARRRPMVDVAVIRTVKQYDMIPSFIIHHSLFLYCNCNVLLLVDCYINVCMIYIYIYLYLVVKFINDIHVAFVLCILNIVCCIVLQLIIYCMVEQREQYNSYYYPPLLYRLLLLSLLGYSISTLLNRVQHDKRSPSSLSIVMSVFVSIRSHKDNYFITIPSIYNQLGYSVDCSI